MLPSIVKKPWIHFLVIGLGLFLLQAKLQTEALPEIVGPSQERIAELRGLWLRSAGYPPDEQQLQRLVDNEINQEILFQEALRHQWHLTDPVVRQRLIRDMKFVDPDTMLDEESLFEQALEMDLHLNDLVVRRRLVQRMEMVAFAPIRQGKVDEQQLLAIYRERPDEYLRPPLVSFQHIFISRDQHDEPQAVALTVQQKLGDFQPEMIQRYSAPFMHGFEFRGLSQKQLSRYFGASFARELFAQLDSSEQPPFWLGPLASSYGYHLVWVEGIEAAEPKAFEEVRKSILAEWRQQQEQAALQRLIQQLRSEYGIDEA